MSELQNRLKYSNLSGEAKNKIFDPTPQRKKYVIELFYKYFTKEISYAELTGIPQKDLFQVAEMGHLKMTYGRIDEAKRIFECLVRMDNRNFYYHAALGSVYQKMKKFVEAVFEYSEALRYNPDDISSRVHRGEIYLLHKNFRKAAEDFREAIVKDPEGRSSYANRARSLVIAIKRNLQNQKTPQAGVTQTAIPSKPPPHLGPKKMPGSIK